MTENYGILRKLQLLLWKNFTLKRRKPFSTFCELVLPVILCLLACLMMNVIVKREHRKAIMYNAVTVKDAANA